jgi:hypothetical protein
MATTFDITNAVDEAAADNFLPEVWAMEIAAAYKSNLVMADLVAKLNHEGKRGDVINIQKPVRGDANAKVNNNYVTLNAHTDTNVALALNNHWEYSRVLEDVVDVQAMPTLRKFLFTDDAGYALAKKVDSVIHDLGATFGAGTQYSDAVIGSDGSTGFVQTGSGNGAALADAGIRRVIQTLDDNDVPNRDRYLVIPPVAKNTLLGLARFTEQAFTGEVAAANGIRNGRVGDVYGVEVYVSSNCASVDSSDCTTFRAAMMFQRDSILLAEQIAPRVQTQYVLSALGTLLVADVLFGAATVRGNAAADSGAGTKAIIIPS